MEAYIILAALGNLSHAATPQVVTDCLHMVDAETWRSGLTCWEESPTDGCSDPCDAVIRCCNYQHCNYNPRLVLLGTDPIVT